jgi:D-inositol-3-phosphate glycosyltransferase
MDGDVRGLRLVMLSHYWDPHVGGIETVARQQAQRFARLGATVEVHTTRLPRSTSRVSVWTPPSGPGSLRVVRHRATDVLVRTLRVPVPIPEPTMMRAVIAAVRRADAVIVHGHTYPTSVLGAVGARTVGRPLVLMQHSPWISYGPLRDGLERAVDRIIGRSLIGAADRVIAVSEHTASYVRSLRAGTTVSVVPNGVDTARFCPSSGPVRRPADRQPVVLFVGRLVHRNGWEVLLDAWDRSELADRAELRIVGTGPTSPGSRGARRRSRRSPSSDACPTMRSSRSTAPPRSSLSRRSPERASDWSLRRRSPAGRRSSRVLTVG